MVSVSLPGSLLSILDPKRIRVWLQKILYVWGQWGRHRTESHSERNIHRKRRGLLRLTISKRRGDMRKYGRAFFSFWMSPQHLARSLRIRDATRLWWSSVFPARALPFRSPLATARGRAQDPLKHVRDLMVDARAASYRQIIVFSAWHLVVYNNEEPSTQRSVVLVMLKRMHLNWV